MTFETEADFFEYISLNLSVRCLSCGALGLWVDMLAVMDAAPRRGYLMDSGGRPVTSGLLAKFSCSSLAEVESLLREIKESGVCRESKDGFIFCPEMLEDVRRAAVLRHKIKEKSAPIGAPRPRKTIPPSVTATVLNRGSCEYCGSKDRLTVDHKIPWSWGGGNEIENLQCLCWECNSAKSNQWKD